MSKGKLSKLELSVAPAAVLLFTMIAMYIISRFDRARILRPDEYTITTVASTVLVFSGIILIVLAMKKFRLAHTSISTLNPDTASKLITSGVFTYTRNPMYLGMALISLSSVFFYGSAWCLIATAGFVAYVTRFQILPEEKALARLFTTEFEAYKANTRRWI